MSANLDLLVACATNNLSLARAAVDAGATNRDDALTIAALCSDVALLQMLIAAGVQDTVPALTCALKAQRWENQRFLEQNVNSEHMFRHLTGSTSDQVQFHLLYYDLAPRVQSLLEGCISPTLLQRYYNYACALGARNVIEMMGGIVGVNHKEGEVIAQRCGK